MISTPTRASLLFLTVAAFVLFGSSLFAQETKPIDAPVDRYFSVDASACSYLPGQELATYHSYGSGSASPMGTFGMVVLETSRAFGVNVTAKLKQHHLSATVTVTPQHQNTQTRPQVTDYDLSDLHPRFIELARDADGRVYFLSLVPRVNQVPAAIQFDVGSLQMENLNFPASPVIVNDLDYIGLMNVSGGALVNCDIPGVAKLEFSLLHLKNARPLGTLHDGVISISDGNGTSLMISKVTNGVRQQVLSGGPFQVWVRWSKPSMGVEQYHQLLKQQVAVIKQRVKDGDATLPPGMLEQIEKSAESGHTGLISSGVGPVHPDDVVGPPK